MAGEPSARRRQSSASKITACAGIAVSASATLNQPRIRPRSAPLPIARVAGVHIRELRLVQPTVAGRHALGRHRAAGLDKAEGGISLTLLTLLVMASGALTAGCTGGESNVPQQCSPFRVMLPSGLSGGTP